MLMNRRRDETGAVAVIAALSCTILLGFTALAVDLGNGFTRTRDVQYQADFAALAGAAKLPGATAEPAAADAAIVEASIYLESDQPQNDDGLPRTSAAFFAVKLTDNIEANGEAYYGHFEDLDGNGTLEHLVRSADELTIRTPPATVDYAAAGVFGATEGSVHGEATVGVFSPGTGVVPSYAVQGCDYGTQTITDPAGGHVAAPVTPTMDLPTDTNNADFAATSPVNPSGIPVQLPAGVGPRLTISGSGFVDGGSGPNAQWVTKVGFFTSPTGLAPENVDSAGTFARTSSVVSIPQIPAAVASTAGVYYLRLWKSNKSDPTNSAGGKWSPASEAMPFRVGDAVLECAAGSSDGNFGTLKLPRNDTGPSRWLPLNIATSLQAPLSLAIHAGAMLSGQCTDGVNGAVVSTAGNLRTKTNCVDTDTGLPANSATQGLVTGVAGNPGRLVKNTAPNCAPGGGSARRVINLSPTNYSINNDVLSCFLTDSTTTLSQLAAPGYAGPAKLSPAIYASPRFLWQPVLKVDPSSGGSNKYSIVDFRPAFITDQPGTASKNSDQATADNGITVQGNDIKSIKVFFFDADALPADDAGLPVTPFLGVGPRIIRLTD